MREHHSLESASPHLGHAIRDTQSPVVSGEAFLEPLTAIDEDASMRHAQDAPTHGAAVGGTGGGPSPGRGGRSSHPTSLGTGVSGNHRRDDVVDTSNPSPRYGDVQPLLDEVRTTSLTKRWSRRPCPGDRRLHPEPSRDAVRREVDGFAPQDGHGPLAPHRVVHGATGHEPPALRRITCRGSDGP